MKVVFFFKISILLVSLIFVSCKKKEKGLTDPAWQFEMLKLSTEYCTKISTCSESLIKQLPSNVQTYTSSIVKQEKCMNANRHSRAYNLVKENPDFIKKIVRDCFSFALKLNCKEIESGKLEENDSCQLLKKYQKG